MKDYYRVLGLDPSAEVEVIEAAYKALSRKYRRRLRPLPGAGDRRREIDEAFAVLNDPMKRAEYDGELHELRSPALPKAPPPEGSGQNSLGFAEYSNPRDGAVMVLIPAGEFVMGSLPGEGDDNEHPQRKVTLDAYRIYKCEVTNSQFRRFVGETGYRAEGQWEKFSLTGRDDHPVINVTWNDARRYCQWAGGRLPTEAEWEKAARGTDGRMYPWGNEWDRNKCNNVTTDSAIYKASRVDLRLGKGTTPVGTFPEGASPYGCLDMAGNVWEWCSDWYDPDYYKKSLPLNPQGAATGDSRVFRGGGWFDDVTTGCRCAFRVGNDPKSSTYLYGFRACFSVKD